MFRGFDLGNTYTVRLEDGVLSVVKFDDQHFIDAVYKVNINIRSPWTCSCANSRPYNCRHITMVHVFLQENLVDSGWLYNFEEQEFIRPIWLDEFVA